MSETIFYAVMGSAVAALALIPLWLKPKVLVGVALLVILFVRTLAHLSGVTALSNADEAAFRFSGDGVEIEAVVRRADFEA